MTKLSRFLYRHATFRWAALGFGAQVFFVAFLLPRAQQRFDPEGSIGVPDLQFGFTPDQLWGMYDAYGEVGRRHYLWTEILLDSLYPLAYTLLGLALLSVLIKRAGLRHSAIKRLNLLPLTTLVFDFSENFFLIQALLQFPERVDAFAQAASVFQMLKWSSYALCWLAVVGLALQLVLRRKTSHSPA